MVPEEMAFAFERQARALERACSSARTTAGHVNGEGHQMQPKIGP